MGSTSSPFCGQSESYRLTQQNESPCHCCGAHGCVVSHLSKGHRKHSSVAVAHVRGVDIPHGQCQATQDPGRRSVGQQPVMPLRNGVHVCF